MSAAVSRIVEFLEIIVKFMSFMSNSIYELIASFPKWIAFFKFIVSSIPDIVVPFVLASFFISIILLLLGRGG